MRENIEAADKILESADDMTAADTAPKPTNDTAVGVRYWSTMGRTRDLSNVTVSLVAFADGLKKSVFFQSVDKARKHKSLTKNDEKSNRLPRCSLLFRAVVRALAFHQCGLGSISWRAELCGLSLLVLYFALRGFSPCTPVFPSHQKPTFYLIWLFWWFQFGSVCTLLN